MKLLEKYYTSHGDYQGFYFIVFKTKLLSLSWFTDCGSWFIYVTLNKKWIRFSDAGFMKGKHKNN